MHWTGLTYRSSVQFSSVALALPGDISALDRIRVGAVGWQQPRILVRHERLQFRVVPVTVDELGIHVEPRIGASRPPARHLGRFPHDVYNARVRLNGICAHVVPRQTTRYYYRLLLLSVAKVQADFELSMSITTVISFSWHWCSHRDQGLGLEAPRRQK